MKVVSQFKQQLVSKTVELPSEFAKSLVAESYGQSLKLVFSLPARRKIQFLGRGGDLSREKLREIQFFRNLYYRQQSPYLLDKDGRTKNYDLELDIISHHIIAYLDNETYGVIRITPYPFECHIAGAVPSRDLIGREEYFELNRLVTRRFDRRLNTKIMAAAAAYAKTDLNAKGIVAICREQQSQSFLKLGMTKDFEFEFKNRENQKYLFLSTTVARLTLNNVIHFGKKLLP